VYNQVGNSLNKKLATEKDMIEVCAFADEASSQLYGQIDALKRNGIKYIELRSVNGQNVKDITIDQAKEYAKILNENRIKVYSIGSPIGKVDVSVDIEEYLKQVTHIFELAKIFGTTKIRMFSFFNAYDKREKVIDNLNKIVKKAKEYGIGLYHENEKDIYGDTIERVLDLLENVSGLKIVYDPANFIQVGESIDKTLDALHCKAGYFHIKDVIKESGELVPAGFGDCKICKLLEQIKDDKVISIEPHLAVFSGYSQIDNTEMKHKFHFDSNDEAFDFAVKSVKETLEKAGYKQTDGGYVKK
jgi:sugar phosphate isomerase/epimerase